MTSKCFVCVDGLSVAGRMEGDVLNGIVDGCTFESKLVERDPMFKILSA